MGILALFLLAVSLAMDAFSVSICGSMALHPDSRLKGAISFGSWFGGFQFLMPVIGYFAGKVAADYITSYDHWIAFFLLGYIGINMIIEKNDECELVSAYSVRKMFTLALATSIDALAVGVSLAFLNVNIWFSSILIGVVTFAFSFVGGIMGFKLGENFRTKSTIIGGIVLCLLGIKILLEGLGYL
jgi:putative Mn2+ efflux pump MntP